MPLCAACVLTIPIACPPRQPGNGSGAVLETQPAVSVTDAGGKLAYTTAPVAATLVEYPSGAPLDQALVHGTRTVESSCGVAVYTDLSVRLAGTYAFTSLFTVGTGNLAQTFQAASEWFSVEGGSIHHLRLSIAPAGFRPNYAFKNQPVVSLEDYGGNRIVDGEDSTIAVTASMAPLNPPEVLLLPTNRKVKRAVFGVAKFNDLYFQPVALGKNISMLFSAPTVTSLSTKSLLLPALSEPFIVGDVATQLRILEGPTSAVTIEMFDPMPLIEVQDAAGNLCTWYEGDGVIISVDLISPPGILATLLGEKSLRAFNGRVRFTDLNIDRNGDGFRLIFRISKGIVGEDITVSSPAFNVSFGVPRKIVIGPGTNPSGASPGNLLQQQPSVEIHDGVGNIVGNAVVQVTATLLQHGKPTSAVYGGSTVRISCRRTEAGECDCANLPCGVTQWPVTDGSGLRVDTVGTNYTFLFTSPGLAPAVSFPAFNVRFGAVAKLEMVQEPCGFALGQPLVCDPVVRVLDKVGNFVPTTGARVTMELVVGGMCCFAPKPQVDTVGGYATFRDVVVSEVPTQYQKEYGVFVQLGDHLRLRFFNPTSPDYVESRTFFMADVGVSLNITQQPAQSIPGFGFVHPPIVELRDRLNVRSGWYPDEPPRLRLTICKEIPCVMGKTVAGVKTGTPCFKCTTDSSTLCDVQEQTPILLRPREIPSEPELVNGTLEIPAFDGTWSFTDLRVDSVGTYFFRFRSPGGFPPIDSEPFTVFAGAPAALFVLTEPRTAPPAEPLEQQPVVAVRDAGGNTVIGDSSTVVTASLLVDSLQGSEEGTEPARLLTANMHTMGLEKRLSSGVAYYQALNVKRAGLFRISFATSRAGVAPCASVPFRVARAAARALSVRRAPTDCLFGAPCRVQPHVDALDAGGNLAAAFPPLVTLRVLPADESCEWAAAGAFEAEAVGAAARFEGVGVAAEPGATPVPASCGGRYVFNATAAGLRSLISEPFLASQPVARVSSDSTLAPTAPGQTLRVRPVAAMRDADGRFVTRVPGNVTNVTVTLIKCEALRPDNCTAVTAVPLIGNRKVQARDARATFTDLRVDRADKCYRLRFDAPGLLPGLSTLFDVQTAAFISLLDVTQQPAQATAGGAFLQQPGIVALDAGLNLMSSLTSLAVSARLLYGAEQAPFHASSRRSETFSAGRAAYTDLRVDVTGCCYRITFEANAKTTVSDAFCVQPAAPSRLTLTRAPAEPAVGWALRVQPVVHVEDAYGNKVDGSNCVDGCARLAASVTATLELVAQDAAANVPFDAAGSLLGARTAHFVNDSRAVAFFSDLRVDRAGGYALRFRHARPADVAGIISPLFTVLPAELRAVRLGVIRQPNGFRSSRVIGAELVPFPFSIQPRVAVQDLGHNTLSSARANVTATLENIGQEFGDGSIVLFGGATVPVRDGVATFTDLDLRYQPSKRLRLRFTSDAACTSSGDFCAPTESHVFDIGGAVQRLEFLRQPPAALVAGETFPAAPEIVIYDASGRKHTWFSPDNPPDNITASSFQTVAASACGPGFHWIYEELRCQNATNFTYDQPDDLLADDTADKTALYVEGAAVFPGLRFERVAQAAEGYRLDFLHTATTGERFHLEFCCVKVAPADPAALIVLQQPNGTAPGLAMRQPPLVAARDRFGNDAVQFNGTVRAVLLLEDGSRAPPAEYPTVGNLTVRATVPPAAAANASNSSELAGLANLSSPEGPFGVANFSGLGFQRAGNNFSLLFEADGLAPVRSTNFSLAAAEEISSFSVTTEPGRVEVGAPFGVPAVVATRDRGGNLAPISAVVVVEAVYGNGSNTSSVVGPAEALVVRSDTGEYTFPLEFSLPTPNVSLLFTLVNASGLGNATFSAQSRFFEVAANASALAVAQQPAADVLATAPFAARVRVLDELGLLVTAHALALEMTAELLSYGRPTPSCPPAEPFQCGNSREAVCAQNAARCPRLAGTTRVAVEAGVARFTDLAIGRCNEQPADGSAPRNDACSQARFRVLFRTTVLAQLGEISAASEDITVRAGGPERLALPAAAISVAAGLPFAPPPEVIAVDAGGNRVLAFDEQISAVLVPTTVTACCFECECPTVQGAFSAQASAGGAVFSTLAVNTVGNGFVLRFEAASKRLEPVSFTFNVLVGAATQLRVRRQPIGAKARSASKVFTSQPEVEILDAGRNVVEGHVGEVSAALVPNDFGVRLGGTTAVAVADGLGRFADLFVAREGSCFVIEFTAAGLSEAFSEPFTVEIGAEDHITISVQPKGARPGFPFDVQPQVFVMDAGDNIDPTFNTMIDVKLLNPAGTVVPLCSFNTPGTSGAPACMSQALAVQGVASYDGLRVDTAGTGYRLQFVFGFLTAISEPFDVATNDAYMLAIDRQPQATAANEGNPGFLLNTQPVVSIIDYGGNTILSGASTVSSTLLLLNRYTSLYPEEVYERRVQIYDQAIQLPAVVSRIVSRPVQLDGTARFSNLRIDRWAAEGYSIRFSAPGVMFVESAPFAVQIGLPYSVGVRRQPAGMQALLPWRVQPVVHVQDRGENTQIWLTPEYYMIASIIAGPERGEIAPLEALYVPIVSGVAVFTSLHLTRPGLYELKFKASTLLTTPGVRYNASAPLSQIAMWREPQGDVAAVPLAVQPHVALRDDFNVTVDIDSSTVVTASILRASDQHVQAAGLSGSRAVQCCWGLCKFTDLVVSKSGQRYVLQFDSPGTRSALSLPFEVFGPSTLRVAREPGGAVSGAAFPSQPRVHVTDTRGALMAHCQLDDCQIDGPAEVTAQIKPGTGALTLHRLTGTLVEPIVSGVASFTDLVIIGAGNGYSERDYVLAFSAIDLYAVETPPPPPTY